MEIYLDNASTTKPFPEVIKAMEPYLLEEYGNPSAIYTIGRSTRKAIDEARDTVAGLLNVKPQEIVFCSGATESICLSLVGAALSTDKDHRRFVTSSIEHKAVLKTANWLMTHLDWDVELIDPLPTGHIDADKFVEACANGCGLASLQLVNNEIGTIQPVDEIATKLKGMNVIFHTDVVQGVGKVPIDLSENAIGMISASGHKFYGPKGSGMTFIREGVDVNPLIVGGGQELERRSGTENVAGAIGLATAFAAVSTGREAFTNNLDELEKIFLDILDSTGVEYSVNGGEPKVPGIINLFFPGVESESLLLLSDRDGVCISAGSACSSGSTEPSYVITALGLEKMRGLGSIRISIGWHNTKDEVEAAAKIIAGIVAKLRKSS